MYGGERGIRTLGAVFDSTHDFQSCTFGQLGHLSVFQGRISGPYFAGKTNESKMLYSILPDMGFRPDGGEGGI